jgi:hypothetical protein
MTAETYHFDKGTEMPFKFQDRWVAGATGFKDIRDAFRHLEWREARRRFAEIAEKYDLDEYGFATSWNLVTAREATPVAVGVLNRIGSRSVTPATLSLPRKPFTPTGRFHASRAASR